MQNPSISLIAALLCALSLADTSVGALPRPTMKSIELQKDNIIVLDGSPRTIQGIGEAINFVTRSNGRRTFCAPLTTLDGINPTITQNVDTDDRIKVYDKLTPILDEPNDSTTIGFSCSVGVDSSWVIGNTLFGDFVRRGYVLQRLDSDGFPEGPLMKVVESNEPLPGNNTLTFPETGLGGLGAYIFRNGEFGGLFSINIGSNDFVVDLVADTSTTYLEGPDTINGFGSYSITATDTMGFGAFSSGFRSGYLVQYADTGEQEELVASQIGAKMTEVNGVPRAVYQDFTPTFEAALYGIELGGEPVQLVTTGDLVYSKGGLNEAVDQSIQPLGATRPPLTFRGSDTEGFCVFFNATVASDPFGPPRLMRYCEGPPPFEAFTDIILSPGEVIDGFEVGTWSVSAESMDGFNVIVRAVDSGGLNPTLIFIGDPPLAADTDSDGVADNVDNCTEVANPAQRDTDGDGYGNFCDPDLNQDNFVDFVDVGLFKERFLSADPDADLDGSGQVDFLDIAIAKALFLSSPGPSGLAP